MAKKEDVRRAAIKKAEGKRPKAQREVAFVTRTLKTPKKPEVWDLMKAGGAVGSFDRPKYETPVYPHSPLIKGLTHNELFAAKARIFGSDPMADLELEYRYPLSKMIENQAQQRDQSSRRDKAHLQAVMEGNPKAKKQAELLQRVQRYELRNLKTQGTPTGHEGYGEILKERIKAYDDALEGKWDGKTPRSGHGGAFKSYEFNYADLNDPERGMSSDKWQPFVKRKK